MSKLPKPTQHAHQAAIHAIRTIWNTMEKDQKKHLQLGVECHVHGEKLQITPVQFVGKPVHIVITRVGGGPMDRETDKKIIQKIQTAFQKKLGPYDSLNAAHHYPTRTQYNSTKMVDAPDQPLTFQISFTPFDHNMPQPKKDNFDSKNHHWAEQSNLITRKLAANIAEELTRIENKRPIMPIEKTS